MKRKNEAKGRGLAAHLEELRAEYRREVEAFAEELRPRFLSGELRGWWPVDDELPDTKEAPAMRLDRLCAARFGRSAALSLLAAACTQHKGVDLDGWAAPRHLAGDVVGRDVLAVARRKGWLAPVPRAKPRPPDPVKRAERLEHARSRLAEARAAAIRELPALVKLLEAGRDFPRDFLAGAGDAQRAMLDVAMYANLEAALAAETAKASA